jgi:signal transduction protein with GAF and PtsI domain
MAVFKNAKEKEEYSYKLSLAKEIISKLDSETDRSNLLEYIVENVAKLFMADGSAIYFYDPEKKELTLAELYNLRASLKGIKVKADQGLLGQVIKNKEAMKVDDYGAWEEKSKIFEEDQYKSLLEAPIIWKNNLLGIIGLVRIGNVQPFSEFDLNLHSLIAIYIGAMMSDGQIVKSFGDG